MDESRFTHLMTSFLDNMVAVEEMDEMLQGLREDPDRQRRLQAHLEVADWIAQAEDELRDGPRFVATTLAQTREDPFVTGLRTKIKESAAAGRRRRRWWPAALAVTSAAAVVLVGLALLRSPGDQPLARITEVNGSVRWTGDGGHVETESLVAREVGGGTLESLSVDSSAVLEYHDGSKITLSGRSQATIVGGPRKEVRLDHGRLSASVTRLSPGQPMLILTPTAQLEVLGTQLNIDADPSATQVNVNEGRVRVTRLVDGSAAEVPTNHQVIASVDRHNELCVTPRPEPVYMWQSRFPSDVRYGQWEATSEGNWAVRALPLLFPKYKPKPLLIYVASATVLGKDFSPLALTSEGRFVVRGRLGSTAEVSFGITMNYPKIGFAGKYMATRKVEVADGRAEPFDWVVSLKDLSPLPGKFPATPVGLEIVECWCLTHHEDHGLAVLSIELQGGK